MTDLARKLLRDALGLPEEVRVRIVTELLASHDGPPDADWDEAWTAELDARQRAAAERGTPAPEWSEARARIGSRRDRFLAEMQGSVAASGSGDAKHLPPPPRTS